VWACLHGRIFFSYSAPLLRIGKGVRRRGSVAPRFRSIARMSISARGEGMRSSYLLAVLDRRASCCRLGARSSGALPSPISDRQPTTTAGGTVSATTLERLAVEGRARPLGEMLRAWAARSREAEIPGIPDPVRGHGNHGRVFRPQYAWHRPFGLSSPTPLGLALLGPGQDLWGDVATTVIVDNHVR
jgi:hypothetical protein